MLDKQKAVSIAVPLIKQYEGYSSKAYQTSLGNGKFDVPTIGYGTTHYKTGAAVKMGDVITPAAADLEIRYEVEKCANSLASYIRVSLNPNQFAALISFAYNIGIYGASKSDLLRMINAGHSQTDVIALWRTSYITAQGQRLQGLVNRRLKEIALYLTSYSAVAASFLLPALAILFLIYKNNIFK